MNKKWFICVLIFLFLLTGCTKKEQPSAIAILSFEEEDRGIILCLNNDYKVIDEIDCIYPYVYYFAGNDIYISNDEENYQGYSLQSRKKTKELKGITGEILYYQNDNSYITYFGGGTCSFVDGQENCVQKIPFAYRAFDSYFYLIDETYHVNVYDLKKLECINKYACSPSGFVDFTVIDSNLYLVTNDGVSKITKDKIELTYYYSEPFDEVVSCKNNRISVYENNEVVIYQLSFAGYAMNMKLELEEAYYKEYDLDVLFADYFEKGFEFVSIIEVEDND